MKKIYIVEDDADSAALIKEILSVDFDTVLYTNGGDLIEFLNQPDTVAPDLFVLDISLPGMDGVTLLRKIRDEDSYKNIPALALTAHAMKGDKESFLQSGFNAYMSKPIVDIDGLINAVKRMIDGN